jgi:hypothetical protein
VSFEKIEPGEHTFGGGASQSRVNCAPSRPAAALTRPVEAFTRPDAAFTRPDAALTRPDQSPGPADELPSRPDAPSVAPSAASATVFPDVLGYNPAPLRADELRLSSQIIDRRDDGGPVGVNNVDNATLV